MNDNNNSPNPFSLIADFDGDISELYNREFNDVLPVLPLRNMTFFPGVVAPVIVGRESSMALVKQAVANDGLIALACQREAEIESPRIEDLYPIGVVAKIMRILELPNGATSVILQSYGRISLGTATRQRPFLRARVKKLEDVLPEANDKEYQVMVDSCKELTIRLLRMSDMSHEEAVFAIQNISHPIFLINFICTNLPFPMQEKQELIAEPDQKKKTLRLMAILNRECQYASLKQHIQNQTREELDQQQKEYFLQQQIKNIQNELGDAQNSDVKSLREKAEALNLPPKVQETFNKELQKLERLNPQNPDYSVELNYLQTLTNLPWGKQTEDKISIPNAERVLNREHYGLEKVKERILEHLALMQYKEGLKTPILCLYGPPGVGKTSLGKSIANALGRKYVRVSLGGVHDEAEVRGHRRTYVGSMPGRIIKGLIKAQTDNPVFVLDEIDKVSDNNYNGDPQSALLEVLDPEQNSAFHDNFLDVDYDLSKVLFVATANSLSTLPRPLLDRMEIISVDGYLTEEKREIARRHLIPRIEEGLGLLGNIKFAPAALEFIIEKYTRESGVRQLEKQLEKIYRKIAFHKAKNGTLPFDGAQLRQKDVEELLGKPLFSRERYQGNGYAGVVTGLAWTAVGGEILFIETSISRSKAPKLTLTGNLGDVMKESAILALEYIKAHAEKLQIDPRVFENWSVHIHVPEGATPKDGPSAGITIATSIASALTQRKVRPHTAMTGEITLRGKVMPVGGIKEKILAAKRAGITDIIMSKENEKDIKEINEKYVHGLTFHFVENVEEVLNIALLQDKVDNAIQFVFEEKHERADNK
ncbi:MAG: endopeptidase La [Alloprevotella tannerae]|jgi:endopeptidase La|uniref:endopeptidase La n=1 Tax=Alloprevotella tannerae TaxID=76122 RepID=UPI001CB55BF3|nr:endopeptidase La [Alloprevotella tannerae]MBF0952139.1 endopeptidase La [Alloprevotella tannerae]